MWNTCEESKVVWNCIPLSPNLIPYWIGITPQFWRFENPRVDPLWLHINLANTNIIGLVYNLSNMLLPQGFGFLHLWLLEIWYFDATLKLWCQQNLRTTLEKQFWEKLHQLDYKIGISYKGQPPVCNELKIVFKQLHMTF